MTDQEVIERGIRAELVLKNETIAEAVQDLVRFLADNIMSTSPEQKVQREQLYYTYQGLNNLVATLNQFVAARLEVEARLNSEEDN